MQNACKGDYLCENINDPTVITDISPQTLSRKTIMKVEFLTEVSKSDYSYYLAKEWI